MAAYWLDTFCMAPESKDHGPPLDLERVDEAEGLDALLGLEAGAAVEAAGVEQAGRHEREQREADDGECGGGAEHVAPEREQAGPGPVQPDEGTGRHHEVGRPVERVPELQEDREVEEPGLDLLLVEDADGLLPVDDPQRVVERVQRLLADLDPMGAEAVPGERVDQVEDDDQRRFLPPVEPGGTLDGLHGHGAPG